MKRLIIAFIVLWAPSIFANSTTDTIRCLKALNGSDKTPFYLPQPAGEGIYVTEKGIYRTGVSGQEYFPETSYLYLKINGDTGPDGICIQCQQGNCLKYSRDWKNSKDFPKDCDKFSEPYKKAESELDLNQVLIFSFMNFISADLPSNLADAKKLRDRVEQLPAACEGATSASFSPERMGQLIQKKVAALKEKYNLSNNLNLNGSGSKPASKAKSAAQ